MKKKEKKKKIGLKKHSYFGFSFLKLGQLNWCLNVPECRIPSHGDFAIVRLATELYQSCND